jgi:hypothetical protein
MELKIFLSVLLVFVPIVFHSNRANASPVNRVPTDHVPERLEDLTVHHSDKHIVSVIKNEFAASERVNSLQELTLIYSGELNPLAVDTTRKLPVVYPDNCLVTSIEAITSWYNGSGLVCLTEGGAGYSYWTITWVIPAYVNATFYITVIIDCEVSKKCTIR